MNDSTMENPNLSSPAPRRTTAIFSKRPEPGRVKTRLCPPLKPEQAAELGEAMLGDVVERLSACSRFRTVLCFAPEEAWAWFAESFPTIGDQRVQVGAGLGERMLHFFDNELIGTVGSSAVAVGSDAPLISTELIGQAHDRLQAGADLVLGPDAGGGYYLIGMNQPQPALFLEIEMSTSNMRQRTVELADRLALKVEQLPPLYDVDVERDLMQLRGDLAQLDASSESFPARTAACLKLLDLDD
ncbi:MAG: rSAM/selenodomain-associated transferase 1 [Planctomycetota bacterium]|jgi:rSAM/selenodomain-associated transferase 1